MKSQLIRYSPFPPGSFTWNDPITGKPYTDTHTGFEERVKQIVQDRLANRRLFTDPRYIDAGYVAQQLSESICARLNNDPRYCSGGNGVPSGNAPVSFIGAPAGLKCVCGSEDIEPIVCVSCGNKRTGWKCRKCGATVQ